MPDNPFINPSARPEVVDSKVEKEKQYAEAIGLATLEELGGVIWLINNENDGIFSQDPNLAFTLDTISRVLNCQDLQILRNTKAPGDEFGQAILNINIAYGLRKRVMDLVGEKIKKLEEGIHTPFLRPAVSAEKVRPDDGGNDNSHAVVMPEQSS